MVKMTSVTSRAERQEARLYDRGTPQEGYHADGLTPTWGTCDKGKVRVLNFAPGYLRARVRDRRAGKITERHQTLDKY